MIGQIPKVIASLAAKYGWSKVKTAVAARGLAAFRKLGGLKNMLKNKNKFALLMNTIFYGFTIKEVADILGVSADSVEEAASLISATTQAEFIDQAASALASLPASEADEFIGAVIDTPGELAYASAAAGLSDEGITSVGELVRKVRYKYKGPDTNLVMANAIAGGRREIKELLDPAGYSQDEAIGSAAMEQSLAEARQIKRAMGILGILTIEDLMLVREVFQLPDGVVQSYRPLLELV